MDDSLKRSLELKIDKTLQAKQRLQAEESLMLQEAVRRHADDDRPDASSIKIAPESERHRDDLSVQLAAMPYLKVVKVGRVNNRWSHDLLYLGPDDVWSKPYFAGEKAAMIAERAKIANGFNISATAHWGKTKAKIREILLPRANQLLQLASVQRLLADALERGERVLVSNGIVFWYEGDEIGWLIKEISATQARGGQTIWKEGTILSKNHGRLVVLPYHPAMTAPIISARNATQLEASLAAQDPLMTPELYARIEALSLRPAPATVRLEEATR
jgi:hypothetical protein